MSLTKRVARQSGPLAQGGMVGLWGASTLVKSIQSGFMSNASETPTTATINEVIPENSLLLHQGFNQSGNTQPTYWTCHIQLTNATTLTLTRSSAGGSTAGIQWTVIEFHPGLIKSVQQGVINMGTNQTLTATVSLVRVEKSALFHLGATCADSSGLAAGWAFRIALLADGVTVRADRGNANANAQVSWRLVEFF